MTTETERRRDCPDCGRPQVQYRGEWVHALPARRTPLPTRDGPRNEFAAMDHRRKHGVTCSKTWRIVAECRNNSIRYDCPCGWFQWLALP